MPTEPVIIVEIETAPGVWTNVSTDHRLSNTKRGKQRALDPVPTGTMVTVLSNANRQYDPEAGSSIAIGQKIRLKATWNTITDDIFTGFIDRIVQKYTPPHDAVAVIECTDGMSRLENATLTSPWEISTEALDPWTWYRFNERTGPYAFDRSGNSRTGQYFGTPKYHEPSLLDYLPDQDSAITFPTATDFMATGYGFMPTTADWSLEFILNMPVGPPAAVQYILYDVRFPQGLLIWISTTGILTAQVNKEDGTLGAAVSTYYNVCDGNTRIFHIVASAGSLMKLYGGYADASTSPVGTASTLVASQYVVGASHFIPTTIDELISYPFALSDPQIYDRSIDFLFWVNDTISARMNRVFNAVGWNLADTSITTESDGPLSGTLLNGSALDHIRAIEATLNGRFWITKSGVAKLLGRNEHLATPYSVSQATFGDAPGELGYTDTGDYARDNLLLTNVVRRYNLGPYGEGSPIGAFDVASIAQYGTRDRNRQVADVESLYLYLGVEASLAQFRVAHYKDPIARIDGLTISPRKDPTNLFPQVLGRELADRITFIRRPQNVGSPIQTDVIIEGISHTIGPKSWITRFSIDAVDARRYFLFDSTLWDSSDWRFAA